MPPRKVPVCCCGNQDGSKRESKARQPTTAIAAPTDRTVRRSASRSCAARERARHADEDEDPRRLLDASLAARRPRDAERGPDGKREQQADADQLGTPERPDRERADEGAEQHDPPDRDPDLAADDDVVAAALQGQVENEHERQDGAGEDRSEALPQSRELSEASGVGPVRAAPLRGPHGLGRLRHRNVRYAVPPAILTLSAFGHAQSVSTDDAWDQSYVARRSPWRCRRPPSLRTCLRAIPGSTSTRRASRAWAGTSPLAGPGPDRGPIGTAAHGRIGLRIGESRDLAEHRPQARQARSRWQGDGRRGRRDGARSHPGTRSRVVR